MFDRLPGFRDFYPDRCAIRNHLFRIWKDTALRFGFSEYDIPILEPLELFTEKSGPEIVNQLFNFTDKGGREVALRPELTPSLARIVGRRAPSLKKPIKWFCIGENFRYEKPQKGRTRSHYQLNCDIFGEPGIGADAELIGLCLSIFQTLGLTPENTVLRLSDRNLWIDFLESLGVTGEAALALLSVIDKMERQPREVTLENLVACVGADATMILDQVDHLISIRDLDSLTAFFESGPKGEGEAIQTRIGDRLKDWRELVGLLEAMGVGPYVRLDLGIVRGLAYYTGFVFEVFELTDSGTEGRALCGGGRYDGLVKKLGYADLHATGFGLGDVTLTDLLEEKELIPRYVKKPDVFVVIGGVEERSLALQEIFGLRKVGFIVEYHLNPVSFGRQFKQAGLSGAPLVLIFGPEETAAGEVKIRDMSSGGECRVKRADLLAAMEGFQCHGIEIKSS